MKTIELINSSNLVIVDDEDFNNLNKYKWYLLNNGSVYGLINKENTSMPSIILDTKISVDHIDRNKLNNQKSNLRKASTSQNLANRILFKNNKVGYKGVYYDRGKYKAQICCAGKVKHLGRFENKEDAALAYNQAALIYFGEFANINQMEEK